MKTSTVGTTSKEALTLLSFLVEEWPDLNQFEPSRFSSKIPDPIVATHNRKVIGGLAFTNYKVPDGEAIVIWLNAVFVAPKHRRQGVAHKLINAAMNSQNCLYALTDIPSLYTSIGWQVVSVDSKGTIVRFHKND